MGWSEGPGVTIGKSAVVAAGSVVTANVPSYEVHGGNPAQFLRRREFRDALEPQDGSLIQRAVRILRIIQPSIRLSLPTD